ncbi:MAG: hypothetical protein ACOC1F_00470 [Myxococcota bacterium]
MSDIRDMRIDNTSQRPLPDLDEARTAKPDSTHPVSKRPAIVWRDPEPDPPPAAEATKEQEPGWLASLFSSIGDFFSSVASAIGGWAIDNIGPPDMSKPRWVPVGEQPSLARPNLFARRVEEAGDRAVKEFGRLLPDFSETTTIPLQIGDGQLEIELPTEVVATLPFSFSDGMRLTLRIDVSASKTADAGVQLGGLLGRGAVSLGARADWSDDEAPEIGARLGVAYKRQVNAADPNSKAMQAAIKLVDAVNALNALYAAGATDVEKMTEHVADIVEQLEVLHGLQGPMGQESDAVRVQLGLTYPVDTEGSEPGRVPRASVQVRGSF